MAWLLALLRQAGPAAIGYFINDVAAFFGKMFPVSVQQKITNDKGGWSWWYIVLLFVVLVGALFFIVKMLMPRGKKAKGIFALGGLAFLLDYLLGYTGDGAVHATQLVTLTTGAAVLTTANLAFLPERIAFTVATQLSGVKISVQGDGVVFDSDANGLTHVGVNRILGQVTNNYVLTLANSVIPKKNVLFEFTNSAAQTPTIYYDSDSMPVQGLPAMFMQMAKAPIFVGGNDFTDFSTLSLPSLAAGDSITITYNDGTVQANMTRADLQYRLGYTQNVINTPIYQIDNLGRLIKSVTVTALAAQTGYIQRWTPTLKGSGIAGEI